MFRKTTAAVCVVSLAASAFTAPSIAGNDPNAQTCGLQATSRYCSAPPGTPANRATSDATSDDATAPRSHDKDDDNDLVPVLIGIAAVAITALVVSNLTGKK